MIACICNSISEKQIQEEVMQHANLQASDYFKSLGIANCCGTCKSHVESLITQAIVQYS